MSRSAWLLSNGTPVADVGVVGAERGLADLQGLLVLGSGTGQIPQVLQHEAQVVAPGADVGVVGAEPGLADGQRALGERLGLPVLAPAPQVNSGPVEQPGHRL